VSEVREKMPMWVFVGEVASFLRMEPEDIRRCIENDGLPVVKIPSKKRTVKRIWLPALYKWLAQRGMGEGLGDFEEFREGFAKVKAEKLKN